MNAEFLINLIQQLLSSPKPALKAKNLVQEDSGRLIHRTACCRRWPTPASFRQTAWRHLLQYTEVWQLWHLYFLKLLKKSFFRVKLVTRIPTSCFCRWVRGQTAEETVGQGSSPKASEYFGESSAEQSFQHIFNKHNRFVVFFFCQLKEKVLTTHLKRSQSIINQKII